MAAAAWYASQAPAQAGRLIDQWALTIKRIRDFPRAFAPLRREARRVAVPNFPYQVWYRVHDDDEVVEVLAVVHGRRDRAAFEERLKQAGGGEAW